MKWKRNIYVDLFQRVISLHGIQSFYKRLERQYSGITLNVKLTGNHVSNELITGDFVTYTLLGSNDNQVYSGILNQSTSNIIHHIEGPAAVVKISINAEKKTNETFRKDLCRNAFYFEQKRDTIFQVQLLDSVEHNQCKTPVNLDDALGEVSFVLMPQLSCKWNINSAKITNSMIVFNLTMLKANLKFTDPRKCACNLHHVNITDSFELKYKWCMRYVPDILYIPLRETSTVSIIVTGLDRYVPDTEKVGIWSKEYKNLGQSVDVSFKYKLISIEKTDCLNNFINPENNNMSFSGTGPFDCNVWLVAGSVSDVMFVKITRLTKSSTEKIDVIVRTETGLVRVRSVGNTYKHFIPNDRALLMIRGTGNTEEHFDVKATFVKGSGCGGVETLENSGGKIKCIDPFKSSFGSGSCEELISVKWILQAPQYLFIKVFIRQFKIITGSYKALCLDQTENFAIRLTVNSKGNHFHEFISCGYDVPQTLIMMSPVTIKIEGNLQQYSQTLTPLKVNSEFWYQELSHSGYQS